jgi:DNA-binding NarL/FixJ family response regulator
LSDGTGGSIIDSLLHRRAPELKPIAISVHDERAVAERVLGMGAAGFVVKGSAATDLLPAIEVVMRGQTCVSASAHPPLRFAASERASLWDGLSIRPTGFVHVRPSFAKGL